MTWTALAWWALGAVWTLASVVDRVKRYRLDLTKAEAVADFHATDINHQ